MKRLLILSILFLTSCSTISTNIEPFISVEEVNEVVYYVLPESYKESAVKSAYEYEKATGQKAVILEFGVTIWLDANALKALLLFK